MSNWKTYKLGEIAEITSSKRIFLSDYVKKGIPFYRSKEIIEKANGENISTNLFITEERYFEIKKKFGAPNDGDLLIAAVGERAGIPYCVNQDSEFYFKDGNLIWFRNFKKEINSKYLYYFFRSDFGVKSLETTLIGSAQRALTIIGLKGLEVSFPEYKTQTQIASILSSLDDKIELNRQMNQTLEAIAQTIFKEWFVNFNFPGFDLPVRGTQTGGELVDGLPKGWKKEPIDKSIEFLNGLALQKFPPKDEKNYLPVIKIRELRQGITESSDKASLNIPMQYIIKDSDILFSWSGSLEVVIWCEGTGALNQHLFKVSSKVYPKWFYYFWTKHFLPKYQSIAEDKATTMGHIQRRHLTETLINVPDNEAIQKADAVLSPLLNRYIETKIENRTLTQIRDTLLPRLMSGKIEIKA